DTVLLDKTGTVTSGKMTLIGQPDPELLIMAASVEQHSEHPIARAIVDAAPALRPVDGFRALPGLGAEGVGDGRKVIVGRAALLAEHGVGVPAGEGVAVAINGEWAGWLRVADTVKPTSGDAIAQLKALGLRPVLLTGDAAATARDVAREVGIAE